MKNLHVNINYKTFNCRTGNGLIPIKEKIILRTVDQDYEGDENASYFDYIYYILPDIPYNIIIGRNLMHKLRYRIIRLEKETVQHKSTPTHILDERDDIFYNKLICVPKSEEIEDIKQTEREIKALQHHIYFIQQQILYPRAQDYDKLRTFQVQKEAGLFNIIETPKISTNKIKCGKIENTTVKAEFEQLIKKYDDMIPYMIIVLIMMNIMKKLLIILLGAQIGIIL